MMISKADFDELFPAVFPSKKPAAALAAPGPAGIARREDDGSLARTVPTHCNAEAAVATKSADGDPARTALALTGMLAVATLAAAWTSSRLISG